MVKQPPVTDEEQVSESYISVGLGLLVVVVVGILLYNYFTSRGQPQKDSETETLDNLTQEAAISAKPGTPYTVLAGDTLWSIAEKAYKSGYNWVDIASANKLSANDELKPGQILVIPEATPKNSTVEVALMTSPPPSISTDSIQTQPSPMESAVPSPAITAKASPTPVVTPTITGMSYTVVKGDTLWDIACRAYGDCYAWTRIAVSNKLINPNLIHPGNELSLPR